MTHRHEDKDERRVTHRRDNQDTTRYEENNKDECDRSRQHKLESKQRETWGTVTKRITCWADADEESSEEPQDEWEKASKAAMKGESDERLATLVNQKLRSTTNEGKARLLQQMRTWPQNVLLRLAASLQSDAWKQGHDFNDRGWQDT